MSQSDLKILGAVGVVWLFVMFASWYLDQREIRKRRGK